MTERVYARRYAEAVFSIALEKNELDRWQADLNKITTLAKDTVFSSYIESSKISFENKVKELSKQLSSVSKLALNLTYLLIIRGRWSIAADICEEYQRLLDKHRGLERARVITAVPLDKDDEQKLEKRLGDIVGKKVLITSEVDKSILGGFIARIDDKLLDGSTRSRLEELKREMAGSG